MTGQAASAPSFHDVAALLANNPELDSPQDRASDGSIVPREGSHGELSNPADLQNEDGGPGPDIEREDAPASLRLRGQGDDTRVPAKRTGQTFEVTVTGDDGKEQTLTVDATERGAGYLRFSDYTKKTQALVKREAEATALVEKKVTEGMQQAAQATNFAMAAIKRLANFQTPEQMLALAQTNPHGHQVEVARVAAINEVLNGLAAQMQAIKEEGEKAAKQTREQTIARMWETLGAEGIDKKALQGIFDVVASKYGIPADTLEYRLNDAALALVMRDAVELHRLREQAEEVRRKSNAAPTQTQRQRSSRAGDQDTGFVRRARAGRANLHDLAGFIERHGGVN